MPRGRPPSPRRLWDKELDSFDVILLCVLEHVEHVRRIRDENLHLNGRIRQQPAVPAHDGAQVGRQQLQLAIGSKLAEDAVPEAMREAIRFNQRPSNAINCNQRQSEAIRGKQRHSEAIRGNRRQSEAIGPQSEAIRGNQTPLEAIRGNQMQSDAIGPQSYRLGRMSKRAIRRKRGKHESEPLRV